jgi:hypothetical protein
MNVIVAKRTRLSSVPGIIVITITAMILKWCRVLDWSWWIIISPVWFSILFGTLVLFLRDNARRLKGDD